MKKKLPVLTSDEEAERFVETADLTEYDLSGFKPANLEFGPKSERVNMRLPKALLDSVKARAAAEDMPYQRYIRRALEESLRKKAS
jgi:predicted DNA binding CopG/RHH family protein